MGDLNKCLLRVRYLDLQWREAERSGSYIVEAPGSNPIYGYGFFISLFSLPLQVLGHSVLN